MTMSSRTMHDVSELMLLSTGNVADAAIGLIRVMDHGIHALNVNMKMFGSAYTVECVGGNNLAIMQAISLAPAGSVVVVNVHGCMDAGHVGDILANAARIRGLAWIVLDGACRDVEEIINLNFPVFARGTSPRGPLKVKTGKLNQPTECGGVVVQPGDWVFADGSGVLVFSADDLQAILEKAKAIAVREVCMLKRLREGKTLMN